MIERAAPRKLTVRTPKEAGPYMMLLMSQLDAVREVLDRHGFKYWVDETSISVNDEPPVTFITFYRTTDAKKVQEALDRELN